jgi:CelD/BcsL family acetyltransferase involved in cellulose biosynthesis
LRLYFDAVIMIPPKQTTPYSIAIFDSLAAAEPFWRALEEQAIFTPYQRFDWLNGILAAGAEPNGRAVIAVVSQNETPLALLPLLVDETLFFRSARFLGAGQSNSDWMMLAKGFDPGPDELESIFAQVAEKAGGFDLLLVQNQPPSWAGRDNPLLRLPHAPGASNLYTTTIACTPLPYVDARIPAKHRGNLRRGRRRLEESSGPVRLVRVNDAAMLERAHAVFLEQRSARFDEMGVDNVFASPMYRAFFRSAAEASFGAERPVMVCHALMSGDEIIATVWGATAGNHYSLYINSTTTGPASRFSLMGILISDLMDELVSAGFETFDLGLGDFAYKREWTDPQAAYHGLFPLTSKGRAAAYALRQRGAIKRRIKQDPRLWAMATNLRKTLFRLRGRKASAD